MAKSECTGYAVECIYNQPTFDITVVDDQYFLPTNLYLETVMVRKVMGRSWSHPKLLQRWVVWHTYVHKSLDIQLEYSFQISETKQFYLYNIGQMQIHRYSNTDMPTPSRERSIVVKRKPQRHISRFIFVYSPRPQCCTVPVKSTNLSDAISIFCCTDNPLVLYNDNTRAHSFYHCMRQTEHTRFLILVSQDQTGESNRFSLLCTFPG